MTRQALLVRLLRARSAATSTALRYALKALPPPALPRFDIERISTNRHQVSTDCNGGPAPSRSSSTGHEGTEP